MNYQASKHDAILNVAENLMRKQGYNGFSIRDVANQVGIKSASVHYHFPAKCDLGVAVTQRYTQGFIASLGNPHDLGAGDSHPLKVYVDAYRQAFGVTREMCLCAVLGAERGGLPNEVNASVKGFFEANVQWLEQALDAFGDNDAFSTAVATIASLEGAMILSASYEDNQIFEAAANRITQKL